MTQQLVPFEQQCKLANAFAKSGLFGIKTPEQGLALMSIAEAEGMHPAAAARDYHIIQGKPALKADAMMARFQQAGGKVEWKELSDTCVSAVFSHSSGGKATITWTLDMAKNAGFAGKDNWKKFPRQMLRSRVVSEGIRTVFPGVAVGIYTPEEVQDFDDKPRQTKNMGQADVVEQKPVQQAKPQMDVDDELIKLGNDMCAQIKDAESIKTLNNIWETHVDQLDDIKEKCPTMYDIIDDRYKKRLSMIEQAPDQNTGEAA